MRDRWGSGPIRALVWLVLTGVLAPAAWADVTVRGRVEVWDEIREEFVPAQHVIVEVERDGAIDDPEVHTAPDGTYFSLLPDPDDTHDGVGIEVYALTRGLCEVRSSVFSWWPYHVTSKAFDGVPAGSTLVIDLRFGKPPGAPGAKQNVNVDAVGYRGEADTTKAFLVHQEILEHHRQLLLRQWPDAIFSEQGVIVPAALSSSYYNHVTNLINLVYAGFTGLGDWPPLPKGDHAAVDFNLFRHTVRHEYSHAIHDRITTFAPFGLNIPSTHSPFMESNRWVAYTEGFADFLVLATVGSAPNLWEASRSHPGGAKGLPVLAGDAWAMEGEVTGLLLDLFDGKGYEVVRNPADRTADGQHALPPALVKAQVFLDDLQDPRVETIRRVASSATSSGLGTVDTIRQFLGILADGHPAPHALKAIGYNRGLRDPLPLEHPAVLVGGVTVRRRGGSVTFQGTVYEYDAEDRPFVRLTARHEWIDGTIHALSGLTDLPLGSGWAGATRPFTVNGTLAPGFFPGGPIWFEVNDDMLPRVYRLAVPVPDDGVVTAEVRNERLTGAHDVLPPDIAGGLALVEPQGPARVPPGTLAPAEALRPLGPGDASWRLVGHMRWGPGDDGRTLLAGGVGFAFVEPAEGSAVGVRVRCRHGHGVGDVLVAVGSGAVPDCAYHVLLHDDTVSLAREEGGVIRELAHASASFRPGDWTEVRVASQGAHLRVLLDGAEALRATDPDPLPPGGLGVGALAGAEFEFDAIAVLPVSTGLHQVALAEEQPPGLATSAAEAGEARSLLRALLREAQAALRGEGEARDLEARLDRSLYELARRRGEIPVTTRAAHLFARSEAEPGAQRPARTAAEDSDRGRYQAWLEARAVGGPIVAPLEAPEKARLGAAEVALQETLRRHGEATRRAADLRGRLAAASRRIHAPDEAAREDTERTVAALLEALERLENDPTCRQGLERRLRAIQAMRR